MMFDRLTFLTAAFILLAIRLNVSNPIADPIPAVNASTPLTTSPLDITNPYPQDPLICSDDAHNPLISSRDCTAAALLFPRNPRPFTIRSIDSTVKTYGGCRASVTVLAQIDSTSWLDIHLGFLSVLFGCAVVNAPTSRLVTGGVTRVGAEGKVQIKIEGVDGAEMEGSRSE